MIGQKMKRSKLTVIVRNVGWVVKTWCPWLILGSFLWGYSRVKCRGLTNGWELRKNEACFWGYTRDNGISLEWFSFQNKGRAAITWQNWSAHSKTVIVRMFPVDEPTHASLAPEFTVCDLLLSSFALVNDTEASVRTFFWGLIVIFFISYQIN